MTEPPSSGRAILPATVAAFATQSLGCEVESIQEIRAGLGLRRYFRIRLRGAAGSLIARVEAIEDPAGRPTGTAPEPPLEPLRSHLEHHGLPVPRRLGGDSSLGIELHEDCGDLSLERAVALAPEHRAHWIRRVVDLIPVLQSVPADSAVSAFDRHLDEALFRYKAALFLEWSLPSGLGRAATPAEERVVHDAFEWISRMVADAPERLAHRDLQSRNLLLSAPEAGARITWIDLQGAFLAPPEYDLVCLLRDSYLPTPEPEIDAHLRAIAPALPDAPKLGDLRTRFDLLTLTRKGKDHARFLYAAETRGDEAGLDHLPATARMLHFAAEACAGLAPELSRLAELIQCLPEGPE